MIRNLRVLRHVKGPPREKIKRIFDFFGAFLLLVFLAPISFISMLMVWIEDPTLGPVIIQERIGKGEKPFRLYKLRTMRGPKMIGDRRLSDAERLLFFGRIFRRYSVDELPQLWNVLKGDMSFIGPRPMPVTYLPYFRPAERVRHSVRPGLSGLAQINGRNFLSWDEKFAFDIEYIEKQSFGLDLKIFFMTIFKVVLPSGVGVRGEDLPTVSLNEERKPWAEPK
jgi:undecaprenyl phosphate N,N'-diacetylbacillosamine 1-phosphate transferase